MPQHDVERPGVAGQQLVEAALGQLVEATVLFLPFTLQEARCHHRRKRQRHEGGNQNCHRQGNGEFPKQPTDNPSHQQQRNQNGDERDAD